MNYSTLFLLLISLFCGQAQLFMDASANLPENGARGQSMDVRAADIDGDNDLDVFLSNVAFIPGKNRQNRLFSNDGDGVFSDVTPTHLPADSDHTIDAIFEDVDLDEDLDLIVCNVFGGPIKICENNFLEVKQIRKKVVITP